MSIHYFMIEAEPLEDNPEKGDYEGAYINCWVRSDTQDMALWQACTFIGEEGWKPVQVEDYCIAERDQYLEEDDCEQSLQCYDQAVENGLSALFYCYEEKET